MTDINDTANISSRAVKKSVGYASTDLLRSSINFLHIVLMVTAAAAPLVVVSAYIPISLAYGSGMAVPITYVAVTAILLVFSVGFVEMAKRITSAGAFYTFTTHGLGKPLGLASGFTITAAYSMITAAIQGGFGLYASALLKHYFGLSVPWYWCSLAALALMFVISYFRVTFTARVLGVALTLEVLVVLVTCLVVVARGGAEGQVPSALNPATWAGSPAVGVGFFLAFWSWIGFETTAIYGEETVDPKQSVPRATYIAVITLGVFYSFAAYAGVVGFGSNAPSQAAKLYDQYFFQLADSYVFGFVRTAMDFLVVTGFFACSFAFHNNASRYFYSLGRDRILPSVLGRTHPVHKSPHIAAGVQALIAAITVLAFAVGGADPLLHLGTWLPIFCTLAVIVVQFLVCLAVIRYFNREGRNGRAAIWKTLVAPAVGALAQIVVVVLLLRNLTFLAGADNLVVNLIPVYVAAVAIAGFGYALILRARSPERYRTIGQLRDEELLEVFPDE
ncbi:APC family permease [Sphaerisporangium sp. NPDC051011]|uniref:APC family permease n=1 Tax=Sphaerisporangium sp. NPDC051011 TaxID=3155792 RepID=UPI0033C12887